MWESGFAGPQTSGASTHQLGAHVDVHAGQAGAHFAVWAPNASSVAVVGDFNGWDADRNPMRRDADTGVWTEFVPGAWPGACYKYAIRDRQGALLPLKADPCARQAELPPATASIIPDPTPLAWTDTAWMAQRGARQGPDAAMSIYEVHPASWRHAELGRVWETLGPALINSVREMGFTHIELLPIMEHPFGGSWGYQPLGMYAPSARYGTPIQFAAFVDACHAAGLGVILDWVPAHFPGDLHGMARFDGTALYEHEDPRQGRHPDWNTLIYNYGRHEVREFLLGSALEWLTRYHVDGLRVDAVASMLYLDYSRAPGEWIPNQHGGRENLEAIDFLRTLNARVHAYCPGAVMIAEESTAWPSVTAPASDGGLGFDYKWNMGWMHDTLRYMRRDPAYRRHHHGDISFGLTYAWSEHFILPLSHDEVVHGKGSLLGKMPGDTWQRFASLRAYLGFMWMHPGKKLLFMGGEFAQWKEWNHDACLDWALLDEPAQPAVRDVQRSDAMPVHQAGHTEDALSGNPHRGMRRLVADLNQIYRTMPALHASDTLPEGFQWIVGDDTQNSVFAFLRIHGGQMLLTLSNFTPIVRQAYRVGVPRGGYWRELLNTDAHCYGGTNTGNAGGAAALPYPSHGRPHSLVLTLPPLATLVLAAQE
ncbi:1,4-alpha-glucan branching protein GlgB [Pusillimonas sp. TS35]|uniref:1,4-alpha-glucan branching protein GlgB n=1 Tax=Paracandidimonas lactea TaxID=2895524 RepID=UPI0013706D67|nr:1,4-alpha-glucan branching protein GlgB [Paracandidimonas lactea]MYN12144.1 1,4-alpha-glucan branching protein GlgB [Pusillimonas sp. TS35]